MMNNRGHLPAGQGMQGGGEMGPGPGGGGGGGGGGGAAGAGAGTGVVAGTGAPRRGGGRPYYNQHNNSYYNQQAHYQQYSPHLSQQPIYNPYGNHMPYAAPSYYPPAPYGGMAGPGYLAGPMVYPPGPNGYHSASPPPMHQYMPMPPQSYSRPPQHSPIVTSPYQAPPHVPLPGPPGPPQLGAPYVEPFVPNPLKAHTPHMSHAPLVYSQPPPPSMPMTSPVHEPAPLPTPEQIGLATQPPAEVHDEVRTSSPAPPPTNATSVSATSQSAAPATYKTFHFPKFPWTPAEQGPFPARTTKSRRRRRMVEGGYMKDDRPQTQDADGTVNTAVQQTAADDAVLAAPAPAVDTTPKPTPTPKHNRPEEPSARSETPSAHDVPSETATSTAPTTPSSAHKPAAPTTDTIDSTKTARPAVPRPAVPALPVVPVLPKASTKDANPAAQAEPLKNGETKVSEADAPTNGSSVTTAGANGAESAQENAQPVPAPAPAKHKPSSWAGLFNKAQAAGAGLVASGQADTNGAAAEGASVSPNGPSGFTPSVKASLGEALQAYRVGKPEKISFLEPRGLINNGNMCYMNSVLQVLLYCIPFYDFLDQVGSKAAFSFKGDTPLIHAMINFQKEFNVIDSAPSAEVLRKRLKAEQLERYGEQFIPKFVYDAIRKLKRFDTMVRGHQQDAEEFLGFLLEGLHDECAQVMQAIPQSGASTTTNSSLPTPTPSVSGKATDGAEPGDVWLEVGPRQRAAVTRSSGHTNISSPITKIFGGQLRSEFKVPGLKASITLQPYQQLQLDIGAPDIHNIVDAMKHITRPETLYGDFGSPNGKEVRATKTVFIESLPSVLILHLKRFQFDSKKDGTVKIWKQIGYPLDLEIPPESLSRQTRNQLTAEGSGIPKYRLVAAVYHHGNEASGGHYTVDVRRQDGQEWVRIDDTVIRRVRSEDVAEIGAEEKAVKTVNPDSRKDASSGQVANRFGAIDDEDAGDDEGWNKVSPTNGNKKYSSVVNGGASTPTPMAKTAKHLKGNLNDNKVAYLLFYERM